MSPVEAATKMLVGVRPGTRQAMSRVVRSQVRLRYKEGANNDTFYGRWYGLNHQPWCAIFISWCAFIAGCRYCIPKHAYTPAGADWFRERGQWGKTPKVGALHYVYNSSLGRIAHVEYVLKVNRDGTFIVGGGNTSNTGSRSGDGVYRLKRMRVTNGSGFGYPAYRANK